MRGRPGFTLVEVVVALALAALVVLLAERLFGAASDTITALQGASEELTSEGNGRRLLGSLLGSLDMSPPDGLFRGGQDRLECSVWSRQPSGWPKRMRVTLLASEGVLQVAFAQHTIALLHDVRAVEMDYLLHAGANEAWVRAWESPASAPLAVRLRLARAGRVDTLLVFVGPRG